MNNRGILKIAIVLFLGLIIKILIGCVPHESIEITYNDISVIGVDNSGEFTPGDTKIDTLFSSAVALRLILSDSSQIASFSAATFKSLSFSNAMATSIDYNYIPKNKVMDIKVATVFDIDANTKAGSDISNSILYDFGNFELYRTKDEAIQKLNGIQDSPSAAVYIILKLDVKNSKAQFKIDILLDDEKHLSCVSDTLAILCK